MDSSNRLHAVTTTNQAALLALQAEARRIEIERNGVLETNRALLAQLRHLAALVQGEQKWTADNTSITVDATRLTEDADIRIDEQGNIRVTEPKIVIASDGTPVTASDGSKLSIGSSTRVWPLTNFLRRGNQSTNSAQR